MTERTGSYVIGYRCVVCGAVYDTSFTGYVCPKHGNEGILDVLYDYEAAARECTPENFAATRLHDSQNRQGMWRYRALLPLPLAALVPPLLVGGTPLYAAPRLAARMGVKHLCIKDDGRSPTASFKDRASALAVSLARLQGATVVATASTGNAAAALAGMSAAMQQPCVIFVPASAPAAKIAQLLTYGATVYTVQGTYDQAFELCMQACTRMGWYNRNTGYNPFMAEGKKTAAYELAEQLNWDVPDALFVSVGDGCIIAGMHKGFRDLKALGLIDRVPRLYGIQAAGSDFMTQAFEN
ncbi:MAG: pyridoxal-phosphate dependent enzyme, partial [Bilophila sp.]